MATEMPQQIFQIKELPTKKVTLYPNRAHVVRDVENVALQPGLNEIEIHGITPTADEHSVQIDAHGKATVTDLAVELVPNHEIFEDVYPPEDEDSDLESDAGREDEEPQACKDIDKEVASLKLETERLFEVEKSCDRRLQVLDSYASTVKSDKTSTDDLVKLVRAYKFEREQVYKEHSQAGAETKRINRQIEERNDERWDLAKEYRKKHLKAKRQQEKEREKKQRQRNEKIKEARRIKEERLRFWPKKVYRVTVQLESVSLDTPASSRRNSMDSVTLNQAKGTSATTPKEGDSTDDTVSNDSKQAVVSLALSYNTREASWTPRYDFEILSVKKASKIIYRAEYQNATSETWKDARVTLSTSQTSYQGLDDSVPYMQPWKVKLQTDSGPSALMSNAEMNKQAYQGSSQVQTRFNRNDVFGSDTTFVPVEYQQAKYMRAKKLAYVTNQANPFLRKLAGETNDQNIFASSVQNQHDAQPQSGGLFGAARQNPPAVNQSALFGNSANNVLNSVQAPQPQAFGSTASAATASYQPVQRGSHGGFAARRMARRAAAPSSEEAEEVEMSDGEEAMGFGLFDGDEQPGPDEPSWTDSGLTATYEVPGTRTLMPSSTTRRYKVATLIATNIHLSHVLVPKLRAAAFLRAKIRNPSSTITLLKGFAGVTLDGSFLGTMILPRVSAGHVFDLPLGVDPGVHVNYPKPSVKRATQGLFNKESAQTFSRTVWLTNTKSTPVELLVLDQIPMSEDERLRIELLSPRGLHREGDAVRAGQAAKEGATKEDGKWGSAVAKKQGNGKIEWTVNLEKGGACLLSLDYEARLPDKERIVQA